MSGICGAVSFDGRELPVSTVERMVAAAPHRSAAGTTFWTAASAALASQRRTGAAGGAVYRSVRGVAVVADARIDNEAELRHALLRSGHLRSDSADPEELLSAAYDAWGEDCAQRVVGDFSFVIWDAPRGLVLTARDPMAMRNLYYRREPGRLLFATEVKQLLADPAVPAVVNETAVAADLIGDFGRSDISFYEGIDQVPPGSTIVFGADRFSAKRFWEIDPAHRVDCDGIDECAEEMQRVFTQAVADRLDSQAPTGILLSGGVDSGSVASTAGWLSERDPGMTPALHAFSWAFDELTQCDERHLSRQIVARYGMRSTDIPADDAGPLACYPEHAPDRDDPFLGAFQPLIEHSLQAARSHGVRVVLGGDRGDLVIGSTGMSYLRMLQARLWSDLRPALREHHQSLGDSWSTIVRRHLLGAVSYRLRQRTPQEWAFWAARRARGAGGGRDTGQVPEWIRPSFLQRVDLDRQSSATSSPAGLDYGRAQRYRYVFTPMHLRGMAWSERTYAREGLGFADPFSDRRVVELALALPPAVVNRPGDHSKPLMRAAMSGIMPEAARRTATKILPSPLYARSLQRRADLVRSLLTAARVEERGWVDAAVLRQHFEQWLAGGPLRPEFWWTIQVETWLRAHEK